MATGYYPKLWKKAEGIMMPIGPISRAKTEKYQETIDLSAC